MNARAVWPVVVLTVGLAASSCSRTEEEDASVPGVMEEPAPGAVAALPEEAKPLAEIAALLESQGYDPIVQAELEESYWEIDVYREGKRLEIRADPATGAILSETGTVPGAKPLSAILRSLQEQGYGPFLDAEQKDGLWVIEAYQEGTTSILSVDPRNAEIKGSE